MNNYKTKTECETGVWLTYTSIPRYMICRCSECGADIFVPYIGDNVIFNFCPNCGAEMEDIKLSDLIEREAAIDAIERIRSVDTYADLEYAKDIFRNIPPAQPVLTCKGCKYDYYEYAGCRNCLRRKRDLYEPE